MTGSYIIVYLFLFLFLEVKFLRLFGVYNSSIRSLQTSTTEYSTHYFTLRDTTKTNKQGTHGGNV
jgi:hypothetical protein